MSVKIKLKRLGKKRQPQYRIVIMDSRKKRDGRAIEQIGLYHPKEDPSFIKVDSDRAQYWLSVGAQPTDAVRAILAVTGDWQKFKGLPGAEGTLKVAEVPESRIDRFEKAIKDSETANKEPKLNIVAPKSPAEKLAEAEVAAEDAPAEEVAEVVEAEVAVEEAPAEEAPAEEVAAEEVVAEEVAEAGKDA